MNEFNVLLAAATNGTPSGSLFDALFARYIAPQESWRELESPLPITILAAGKDLIDYRIFGNTENGESVGERTENLYNGAIGIDNARYNTYGGGEITYDTRYEISKLIPVLPNTNYTLSWDHVKETSRSSYMVAYYDLSGINCIGTTELGIYTTDLHFSITVNTPTNCGFVRLQRKKQFDFNMMFNLGSTAPTSYIPYGYKLPMVVRSRNLFDGQGTDNYGYYNNDNGSYVDYKNAKYWRFPVEEGDIIRWTTTGAGYGCYFSNGVYKGRFVTSATPFTVPADVDEITNNFVSSAWNSAIVTLNQPLPDQYIPYYRDEENIYIGSNPLAEDEYVSYSEQKIYRMEGGTLTPTDPPVPIPALPTIQGETIIDYNPSTTPAVEPEKMYIKYKPQ